MSWTYSTYTGANYGISFGLVTLIMAGVFITFVTSKKGKEFVHDRIAGVDPNKAHDDNEEEEHENKTTAVAKPPKAKKKSTICVGCLLCLLGAMALSIAAVLIFQGCVLFNTRLLAGDNCPEYSLDCFVFNGTSGTPLSETPSFSCDPNNKTQFPMDLSNGVAHCFGWIIMKQTTKSFLDQLGVCTGLIGLFSTLLAVVVYLGKSIKSLILSIIFILCCVAAVILLVVFKWSYAPLTYAVFGLCLGLGVFGIMLYVILPKPENAKSEVEPFVPTGSNKAQTSVISFVRAKQAFSSRREPPPSRTVTGPRSNWVVPE
jgi:hypothetical protein